MKIKIATLNRIKDRAHAFWLEGKTGIDGSELVVYSYLKAIEQVLNVRFEYDLPNKNEAVNDED